MDSKSFGRKLRAYRAQCGWDRMQCAEKIGITVRYLIDIERGDKIPKLETFVQILNTLTASADDVLQDSLVVGYIPKCNNIQRSLESLEVGQRKQATDLIELIISTIKENQKSLGE